MTAKRPTSARGTQYNLTKTRGPCSSAMDPMPIASHRTTPHSVTLVWRLRCEMNEAQCDTARINHGGSRLAPRANYRPLSPTRLDTGEEGAPRFPVRPQLRTRYPRRRRRSLCDTVQPAPCVACRFRLAGSATLVVPLTAPCIVFLQGFCVMRVGVDVDASRQRHVIRVIV